MADIEKIMYDLMDIKERNKLNECEIKTISDAILLLIEQEKQIERLRGALKKVLELLQEQEET